MSVIYLLHAVIFVQSIRRQFTELKGFLFFKPGPSFSLDVQLEISKVVKYIVHLKTDFL